MLKHIAIAALFSLQANATTYNCQIESRPDHKLNVEISSDKTENVFYEFPHYKQGNHEVVPLAALFESINGVRGEFFVDACKRDENLFDAQTQDYLIHSECTSQGQPVVLKLRFSPSSGGEFRYSKRDGTVDSLTFVGCQAI